MRILVTGITGFAGSHLAERLLGVGGAEIYGTSRHGEWPAELQHLKVSISLHACQLTSLSTLETLLRRIQPEQIYHLAGYAQVAASFREPDRAWADNLMATRNLYSAIERWGGKPRVLHVSSGLVYGGEGACTADTPLAPASPYATSKAAADLLSFQVTRHPGIDVVRVRPFNQIGPRQSPEFAVARFARQLARIEAGQQSPVLETGDLSPGRDLTDVRDMVEAYRLVMQKGTTGEVYPAGSGTLVTMRGIVARLCTLIDQSVEIRQKPELLRPADPAASRADIGELTRCTDWSPQVSLGQSLLDILDYWRRMTADSRQLARASA